MVSFHRVSVFSYLIIKRIYSTFRFKRGIVLLSIPLPEALAIAYHS